MRGERRSVTADEAEVIGDLKVEACSGNAIRIVCEQVMIRS